MTPRRAIFDKEFRDIFKERTILIAVLIQVFVAGLSSFLVVGLSALTDPSAIPTDTQPDVAVVGPDGTVDALLDAGLSGRQFNSESAARQAFQVGDADAVLVVDRAAANNTTAQMRLLLPDGDVRATLTLVHVQEALQSYERTLRQERGASLVFEPVYVDAGEAGARSYEFAYGLLVPLLVFLPVVLAGALTADSLTEEVERDTLPVLLTSPATPADVVEGKILANATIAPLLTVAWLGLLYLNDLPVPLAGAVAIVVVATAAAVVMCLIAAAAGLSTRDRNKAQVLYTQAMLVLIVGSLLMPMSPVNAVALLAAGSTTPMVWAIVAGTVGLAAVGLVALRVVMRLRAVRWAVIGGG